MKSFTSKRDIYKSFKSLCKSGYDSQSVHLFAYKLADISLIFSSTLFLALLVHSEKKDL